MNSRSRSTRRLATIHVEPSEILAAMGGDIPDDAAIDWIDVRRAAHGVIEAIEIVIAHPSLEEVAPGEPVPVLPRSNGHPTGEGDPP